MPRVTSIFLAVFTLAFAVSVPAQTAPPTSGTKNAINGINSYPGPEFVKYGKER